MAAVTASARRLLEMHGLVDEPGDLERARLHTSGPPAWYIRAVKKRAITLGRHVWVREVRLLEDVPLLAHEIVHVRQFREMGTIPFLWRYFWGMARAGFRYSRRLPLEVPAYAKQRVAEERLELR
ncbi:MAG: DUF4157 domain-containing protein [Dehalococcoidia bacterium]|nr:DUF4157 domain-containing protein [Dehalococcoidia bacterium]MCB9484801.1 DUF4157 domain-containing protein [Thermoflexaceae bacterium]